MVQRQTLPPPEQLAAEGVQLIVGLLAEHQACKERRARMEGRLAVCTCVSHNEFSAASFTLEGGESLLSGVGRQGVVRGRERLSVLEVGLPGRGNITSSLFLICTKLLAG